MNGVESSIDSSISKDKKTVTNNKGAMNWVVSSLRVVHTMTMGILLIVIASFAIVGILFLCGNKPYIVLSGSMEPNIHTGSVCFINTKVPYEDIKVGDVIAFEAGSTMVTHRVVNISEEGIETKGDANDVSDAITTTKGNYKGINWLSIPYLGYICQFMQTIKGKIIIVTGFVCLVILMILYNKVCKNMQRKENVDA